MAVTEPQEKGVTPPQDCQELALDSFWKLKMSTDGRAVAVIGQKRVYKQSCEDS